MKNMRIIVRDYSDSDYQSALNLGLTPLQARIFSSRIFSETASESPTSDDLQKIAFPKLKHIQHPNELKNSDLAAQVIADAIEETGKIVLATDYDTDGVTSAWVATKALIDFFKVPEDRIVHMIGERKNGYGITEKMCDDIIALSQKESVSLVISADQGSSDEPRIKRLANQGIKVCVTDHHQMAIEGAPESAVCTVNPQQDNCQYDKTVAGCFVIFLVMGQVRNELIKRQQLAPDAPSLKTLALNVALGTVADSVSLKSANNRAIVTYGLSMINRLDNPAWQAIHKLNNNQNQPINAEYLGFQVATRINAASRVSDVTTAFQFLNATDFNEAQHYLQQLDMDNEERKCQQQTMLDQALKQAEKIYQPSQYTLTLRLTGNAGIQGIIASRLGEKYGLPTIAMTELEDGHLAGSGRGIVSDVDLRQAFQWMSEQQEGLFISMGGHAGAAGCMIPQENFTVFSELFEQAIKNQLGEDVPQPTISTDGELSDHQLDLTLVDELKQLEPYGREWPQPVFSGQFVIDDVKAVGQTKTHLSFKLRTLTSQKRLSAIFFNALDSENSPNGYHVGQTIYCAYQPNSNFFMGRISLQLRILGISEQNQTAALREA